MEKTYREISDRRRDVIESQPLFLVAMAPPTADGQMNVCPRGLDSFPGSPKILRLYGVGRRPETGSGRAETGSAAAGARGSGEE